MARNIEQEQRPLTIAGKHPYMHAGEAGAIAGEVTGAIVGSAAGPAGTLAGMVIGGLTGALIGRVMEREDQRASARNAELDRDIGVTQGNIGTGRRKPPLQ